MGHGRSKRYSALAGQPLDAALFKALREHERIRETAGIGPGAYFGNEVNFGVQVNGGVIHPPKAAAAPRNGERAPGPGEYAPERADGLLRTSMPVAKFVKPTKLPARARASNPDPGAYDSFLRPFGEGATTYSITKPAKHEKIAERPIFTGQERELSPGPGKYEASRADSHT